jgi:hypothetical protein
MESLHTHENSTVSFCSIEHCCAEDSNRSLSSTEVSLRGCVILTLFKAKSAMCGKLRYLQKLLYANYRACQMFAFYLNCIVKKYWRRIFSPTCDRFGKLLLVLASTVVLGSESSGTRGHISHAHYPGSRPTSEFLQLCLYMGLLFVHERRGAVTT